MSNIRQQPDRELDPAVGVIADTEEDSCRCISVRGSQIGSICHSDVNESLAHAGSNNPTWRKNMMV